MKEKTMIDDDEIEQAAPDEDEAVEQVMAHAAVHLLVMDTHVANSVRAALRQDAKENPGLAHDPDRVCRMVERYVQAAAQGDVTPAAELENL
jgi:hypothetical protein